MALRLAVTTPGALDAADRLAEAHEAGLRPSVSIATAARTMECDETTIRALLRSGKLAGHRVGKGLPRRDGKVPDPRGVRIYVDTIRAYQASHPAGGEAEISEPAPKPRPRRRSGAQLEAIARLHELGVFRHGRG